MKEVTEIRCSEDIERKFWKLIREDELSYKGQIFKRLIWVYPCGGTVKYKETIDEKGNRIYIVERFELSPKSWVEERPIAEVGSYIEVEEFNNKKEALELAGKWLNEVIPCEVWETEKQTVFRFKTGMKPLRVKRMRVANQV